MCPCRKDTIKAVVKLSLSRSFSRINNHELKTTTVESISFRVSFADTRGPGLMVTRRVDQRDGDPSGLRSKKYRPRLGCQPWTPLLTRWRAFAFTQFDGDAAINGELRERGRTVGNISVGRPGSRIDRRLGLQPTRPNFFSRSFQFISMSVGRPCGQV